MNNMKVLVQEIETFKGHVHDFCELGLWDAFDLQLSIVETLTLRGHACECTTIKTKLQQKMCGPHQSSNLASFGGLQRKHKC